ncbi:MAG: oxygenase MpaB family protein [Candidatus Eiseniibacteriota bacterium]
MPSLPSPERCQAIAYRLACFDFPWDVTRALELALFRTFASPSIAGTLRATGEFEARPQRRYDDTDLIVSMIIEHGFDSEIGGRAIARMNALHGRFRISNEDFLFVLSTFVFDPLAWLDRFGWRRLTDEERLGWFGFWREVGRRMAIRDIPDDIDAFQRFSRDYEARRFRRTEPGQAVASATRDMFARWFPRPLAPLVRLSINGLLDARTRDAFGFAAPGPLGHLVGPAMAARALALRLLPKRRRPRLRTQMKHRSYPSGWRVETLGPPERGAGHG